VQTIIKEASVELFKQKGPKLQWVGPPPANEKKIAILIPQYNEASNCNIEKRLQYFKSVAETFNNDFDLIIIDDGSTDNSLDIIVAFVETNAYPFYVASVKPNCNKVGALHLAVEAISHAYVVLSDFDTDTEGFNRIIKRVNLLDNETSSMGLYFRLLPFEGNGIVFNFQQIEYAILRSLYKYYKKDGSVPVMPGAGSCYRRSYLIDIYRQHSGLRNGEDREATMIGLKMGYSTHYEKNVLSLTRPPLTFKALVRQRFRWNLGYLETWQKERRYYQAQVKRLSFIGIIFMFDVISVLFMVSLPLVSVILLFVNLNGFIGYMLLTYVIGLLISVGSVFSAPMEFVEIKGRLVKTVALFPVIKLLVGYFSWVRAIKVFIKKIRNT